MDKTPSRKDSASAFQDRTPLRKDFASEFQLDKETDSSDDDCYNESMDTQDYDNVGCQSLGMGNRTRGAIPLDLLWLLCDTFINQFVCPCDTTTTAYTFCYSWFHSRARWVIHEASHEVIDTL